MVNAIQSGGDWDSFSASMKSFDTWKGCISSTAGSLVTNSLNEAVVGARYENVLGEGGKKITRLEHSKLDGFNSSQIGSISSFNSTIGSLASTAVTYGLTGEATFNVLNISDFGAGASSGLLEVALGGKKGFSSRIGTGGTDVSMGNLKTALAGINNLNMNSKIKKAAKANNMENAATALRMQYGFGDEKQMQQLDDILNGKAAIKAGDGKGDAQTVMENGQRTVYLNKYKENMTREEKLAMGITLGHESYRDGVVGTQSEQINETVGAVFGHTVMADKVQKDKNYEKIMKGIIADKSLFTTDLQKDLSYFEDFKKTGDIKAFGDYVLDNYDYSADYWKVLENGNIGWDGQFDLFDENGSLLHHTDKTSYTEALAEHLGITQEAANSLIVNAGYDHFVKGENGQAGYFVGANGRKVTDKNEIQTSEKFKASYDFQVNYADKVLDKYNGNMVSALQDYHFNSLMGETLASSQIISTMMSGLYIFAEAYDDSIQKFGNVGSNNITKEIYENIYNQTGWQSNNNILYEYLKDGTISPVVGYSYITTKAFYEAGLEYLGIPEGAMHSTSINGTAVDLGTNSNNHPVVSVFNSSFLIDNSYGYTNGGGNYISLYTNNLKTDYKHLLGSSNAYNTINSLNSYGRNAGIWSFPVPSNYQIGNVGNSGTLTTNIHLHFQNTRLR
ncbi:hypothetical protein [Treponema sp. Marseille-Q3903]|uniref:hypothetical protein n=1 Tax=Treponema sp. Marseille-Q3903 TaxID=2766703 RepID=UPI0016525ED1|nr:hypothetical protein [Treponema sp. Marseille-Q3903]MBC6714039.1 hypothetical protein [Treponema sp. Marseille-Q3903]